MTCTVTASAPEVAPLDLQALEAVLRARILRGGLVAAADADAGRAPQVRVRIEIATEVAEVKERGAVRAEVHLRVETRPEGVAGALAEDAVTRGERQYAPRPAPDRRALLGTLTEHLVLALWEGFEARARLRTAPAAEVHAALAADAGELREEAIRMVATRGLRQEVPRLVDLLGDPDEQVRDAALGALVELREPRAVTALTRSRSFKDRRELRKILEAVATIGGDEAADYLTFVAQTHDDPEIREMAEASRRRLERRRAGSSDGRPPGP